MLFPSLRTYPFCTLDSGYRVEGQIFVNLWARAPNGFGQCPLRLLCNSEQTIEDIIVFRPHHYGTRGALVLYG